MACWSNSSSVVKPKALTIVCYVTYVILSIPFNLAPIFLTVLEVQYAHPGQAVLSDEDLGRLTAAPFLGVSVSTIGTSLIADRFGAKPAGLFGNFVSCLGLVLSGLAPEYWSLCVALFVLGVGAGSIDMIIPPVVSSLNPTNRGQHMNYLNAIYWVGAVLANLLVITALWVGMTFNQCCFMLAPCPAMVFVGMLFYKFPPLTEGPAMPFRQLICHRWFQASLVAITLGGATTMGLANWINYYVQYLGFSPQLADWMLLLFGVCMFLGRMIVGKLSTRVSLFTILPIACVVSCVLVVLASFGPPELCVVSALLVGLVASPMWPTILAVSADEFPGGGPYLFGLLSSGGNFGGFFMPWIVGGVAEEADLRWGLASAALTPLLMVPLILWMRNTKTHHWTRVAPESVNLDDEQHNHNNNHNNSRRISVGVSSSSQAPSIPLQEQEQGGQQLQLPQHTGGAVEVQVR